MAISTKTIETIAPKISEVLQIFWAQKQGKKGKLLGGRPKAASTIRPGDLARARALFAARENTVAEIMQLAGFKNRSTFYEYVVNAEKEM